MKTAMQELIEKLSMKKSFYALAFYHDNDKIIKEALEKEKEQIMDAVSYGCSDWGSSKDVEKYYNETYK